VILLNVAPMKRCTSTGCGPRSVFMFTAHAGRSDGLSNICVDCKKLAAHESYLRHKTHVRAKNDAWAAANVQRKREADRVWYEANRERHHETHLAWLARNEERIKAWRRAYWIANKERLAPTNSARNRRRYALDPAFRESRSACSAAHRRQYPERHAQLVRLREARKRGTCPGFPLASDILEQRASVFGFACAYCRGQFETWDHVKPLASGGKHCLANLRPACKSCNSSKGAEPLIVWMAMRGSK
jgi:5-methylcytosine-specific restriction endonuclease McrA